MHRMVQVVQSAYCLQPWCGKLLSGTEDENEGVELVAVQQPRWVNELMHDLSRSSPGKQIAVGGVTGLWVFTAFIAADQQFRFIVVLAVHGQFLTSDGV